MTCFDLYHANLFMFYLCQLTVFQKCMKSACVINSLCLQSFHFVIHPSLTCAISDHQNQPAILSNAISLGTVIKCPVVLICPLPVQLVESLVLSIHSFFSADIQEMSKSDFSFRCTKTDFIREQKQQRHK